jgi:hypothetical protein
MAALGVVLAGGADMGAEFRLRCAIASLSGSGWVGAHDNAQGLKSLSFPQHFENEREYSVFDFFLFVEPLFFA